MNKRQFLTPLAVSIAALLGGTVIPAQASTVSGTPTIETSAPPTEASAQVTTDQLILTRSTGGQLRLADHESHASHESHSSHVSGG